MKNRVLWRIPVLCFIAGLIYSYGLFPLLDSFLSIGGVKSLYLPYTIQFVLTLVVAYFVVRDMSAQERVKSAALTVGIHLLLVVPAWLAGMFTGINVVFVLDLAGRLALWAAIVTLVAYELDLPYILSIIVLMLMPFVFVLLPYRKGGRRQNNGDFYTQEHKENIHAVRGNKDPWDD